MLTSPLAHWRYYRKSLVQTKQRAIEPMPVCTYPEPHRRFPSHIESSVFILERLTDEDITQILVQAIERVSLQQPDDISEVFMRSSSPAPPPSSSSPAPTLPQLPASSQSSTQSSSGPSFPSFPSFLSYPHLTSTLLQSIVSLSIGDARTALSMLELLLSASPNTPSATLLTALRRSVATAYDRGGDARYDMISALHKSVRGSDGSAAMYWLARMLSAGEDPVYIARRMTVCASEDVGLADNHALPLVCPLFYSWTCR